MDSSDIRQLAEKAFGAACVPRGGGAFSLVLDGATLSFAPIPGDPGIALVRSRVLDLDGVARKGGLALAALEANFFWSGTNGGTLSAGADGALWLTERRPVEELAAPGGLEACVADFVETVSAWRERSEHMLGTLGDEKNRDIYQRALVQARGDLALRTRLEEAWQAVQDLPDDATLDAKVDAAHELLVALTLAFRSVPPAAAA